MKETEKMSIAEIRTELRQMGVTEKLMKLILREMAAAEKRIEQDTKKPGRSQYDPVRAQLYVLKANGMTNPDLTLNRKGMLFIALTTREASDEQAA
jgi:hypothetical protein